MKLGIMQPYFFPYIGYFSLIANSERWIVFDITQYTRKSWLSRNRLLHPSQGWNYISASLQHSSTGIAIHEARVSNVAAVGESLIGKMSHYRRHAPHFRAVMQVVEEALATTVSDSLVHLNVAGLAAVCKYLDIGFAYSICSEMALPLPASMQPGGWAPKICELLGATGYLNPIGGSHLFQAEDFQAAGIELEFLEVPTFTYATGPYAFEPSLSILDVMMWNDVKTIREVVLNGKTRRPDDVCPDGGDRDAGDAHHFLPH